MSVVAQIDRRYDPRVKRSHNNAHCQQCIIPGPESACQRCIDKGFPDCKPTFLPPKNGPNAKGIDSNQQTKDKDQTISPSPKQYQQIQQHPKFLDPRLFTPASSRHPDSYNSNLNHSYRSWVNECQPSFQPSSEHLQTSKIDFSNSHVVQFDDSGIQYHKNTNNSYDWSYAVGERGANQMDGYYRIG